MAPDPPSSGELFFGIDARHIRQLGQELVGDRVTALTELIKNAYDADATAVALDFDFSYDEVVNDADHQASAEGGEQPAGETSRESDRWGVLVVEDNGNGMTLDDLRRGWMRISTADKEVNAISPRYGRRRAGRKGIGRFATETLGRRLRLWTTVAGSSYAVVIDFDWENDYATGAELTEIANSYWTETAPADSHGTRLRIEALYDRWDRSSRDRVRRALRLLQPPFPVAAIASGSTHAGEETESKFEPDPGFEVRLAVDGVPEIGVEDVEGFLGAATAQVTARVDAEGRVHARFVSEPLGFDAETELTEQFPASGSFSVTAAYFIYSSATIGSVTVRLAQQLAENFAGIRVYRDGLRVMPYGERGNDWLGLDELSRSRSRVLVPIANVNWFGQVALSRRQNPDLRDTASREGLVENEAYAGMRQAVRRVLEWAAVEVGQQRQRKTKASERRPRPTREDILKTARDEIELAARRELAPGVANKVVGVVNEALSVSSSDAQQGDRLEATSIDSLVGEVELLRILASLGTSIAVFSHEVRSVLNTAIATLAVLEKEVPSRGSPRRAVVNARASVARLAELAGYIDAFASASQRRVREPQPMHTIVREFVERMSTNLARGVQFSWSVEPSSIRTQPMTRSELEAVLINFLTNAVKAMDEEHHGDRRINIAVHPEGRFVVLRFQDTGAGIPEDVRDRVFDAFFTDARSSRSELGTGTGLGLKVVSDIAEANGGEVVIGDADGDFSTCLEVRLPRWREQLEDQM